MNSGLNRRCLLITPLTFYTFHERLKAALEGFGYSVDLMNEEYPSNIVGKIFAKLALTLVRRTTLGALRKHLSEHPRYDLVLIVKGRGLGPRAIKLLKQHADRVVGYNFDSFRFNPSPLDWHALADRYATFDIVDAQSNSLPLVHLFSAATGVAAASAPSYDISIVMRIHSDRLAYVDRVLRSAAGRPVFAFLYAPSWLAFLPHAIRSPVSAFRLRQHISFTPLSYERAMGAISNSRATLDYAHPLQSGITVRCYEALSMGVPVITNNAYVANSGVFPEGAVETFPLNGPPDQLTRIMARFDECRIKPTLRTIDEFIAELLEETPANQTVRIE
ncbi:MAG: hypothetical protein B7Y02_00170 [Rhodobacterales bacterium 17-64-5]|nr:MAG: hypothetical protein B7Y02_00170 [Rhodobacterales bacterium 17-64-5]